MPKLNLKVWELEGRPFVFSIRPALSSSLIGYFLINRLFVRILLMLLLRLFLAAVDLLLMSLFTKPLNILRCLLFATSVIVINYWWYTFLFIIKQVCDRREIIRLSELLIVIFARGAYESHTTLYVYVNAIDTDAAALAVLVIFSVTVARCRSLHSAVHLEGDSRLPISFLNMIVEQWLSFSY